MARTGPRRGLTATADEGQDRRRLAVHELSAQRRETTAARDARPWLKTSMMRIRPPQQGHAGSAATSGARSGSGSAGDGALALPSIIARMRPRSGALGPLARRP